MATERSPITRDEAAEMLRAVVRDHPDLRNPVEYGACLYTDAAGNHCGVGQLLTDADLPCPVYGSAANIEFFGALPDRYRAAFEPDAVDLINRCQVIFDVRRNGDLPRRWGDPELVTSLERELS